MEIKDLNPHEKNPRRITEEQFSRLEKSVLDLGDLGGVVFNRLNKKLIGGHRRTNVFQKCKAKIEILTRFDKPDSQGTVALGFIDVAGKKYAYREVEFTEDQHEAAMIIANRAGGDWDTDMLANNWNEEQLKEWGFEDWELGGPTSGDIDGLFHEAESEVKDNTNKIILEYSKEEYILVDRALGQHSGSRESVIFKLLGL